MNEYHHQRVRVFESLAATLSRYVEEAKAASFLKRP
jgi:hypothetical protein